MSEQVLPLRAPGIVFPGAEARPESAYRTAHDLARHYRDEVVPLRKRISQENVLRYNGMLIGVFELLADSRDQVSSVTGYVEATRTDDAEKNRLCPPAPFSSGGGTSFHAALPLAIDHRERAVGAGRGHAFQAIEQVGAGAPYRCAQLEPRADVRIDGFASALVVIDGQRPATLGGRFAAAVGGQAAARGCGSA